MAPTAVGKEQRKFNYFVLVLQWQGTICSSTRHCRTINGCCRLYCQFEPPQARCHRGPALYTLADMVVIQVDPMAR
ncbi:uncharacterized protein LOC123429972 [Hordeum vulgare subsp. vulgare]|uniref:Predicted protein n=1 Tax=Hordeum vulgare subsp. vulgare TaxID=112509 RepID=F2DC66_HORVV|nr:uncharacterized protein LOC123429972 [Hordeum vulgare subsp. vulgare]BAJ92687.1 predicted protein [Hordeum vulgare subsp. vulgare]